MKKLLNKFKEKEIPVKNRCTMTSFVYNIKDQKCECNSDGIPKHGTRYYDDFDIIEKQIIKEGYKWNFEDFMFRNNIYNRVYSKNISNTQIYVLILTSIDHVIACPDLTRYSPVLYLPSF